MTLALSALAVLAAGGVLAALLGRWPRAAGACGAGACVLAACLGLPPALTTLAENASETLSRPWPTVPGAALSVRLDALAALFLALVLGVSAVIAVYCAAFFSGGERKPAGLLWLWLNLLVAGMGLTVLASNAILFLVAWEVMSLAAYFLVASDDERPGVRQAGWTYLVAAHLGAAFLVALFALLGARVGSLEMQDMARAAELPTGVRNVLFLLALVGFGAKAGVWPLHVWLPDSYAAAPGPVPALLSGVMSKMGFYGLLRLLGVLGPPQGWWAVLLIALGVAGAVFGILYALGQHDLKRVLACSSIENAGIILLGVGVGLLGLVPAVDRRSVALLGLGGALLHVLNHSLCKSLLFLSCATVERAAGTLELDRLGGLLRRLPLPGAVFLLGAAAISGLPPLNCFASEFLIYLSAFQQTALLGSLAAVVPLAVIAALALAGGLAVACFTRVASVVFLGAPRAPLDAQAPVSRFLLVPPAVLALGCVLVALAAPAVADALLPPLSIISGISYPESEQLFTYASGPLFNVVQVSGLFLALLAALALLRRRLLRGREVLPAPTWGCGYTRPTPRIQYTASSFSGPLLDVLGPALGLRRRRPVITDYFPSEGGAEEVSTTARDLAVDLGYATAFCRAGAVLGFLHFLQAGRVQVYVLYIVLTLLVLLVGALGG
jgi:formate hydrogenlyase subunit 3/multisubunit Na+/H+ antiporter MnhD subunit